MAAGIALCSQKRRKSRKKNIQRRRWGKPTTMTRILVLDKSIQRSSSGLQTKIYMGLIKSTFRSEPGKQCQVLVWQWHADAVSAGGTGAEYADDFSSVQDQMG